MVAYCIIHKCKNNSKNKENDSYRNILFHVFPLNPELKAKWLMAIGLPVDWEPPDNARICSDHFKAFQISQINSKFEDSLEELCRICLATNDDMTLYSLKGGKLKKYMDAIFPMNKDPILPQFVCLECAVHLKKSYNMIQKYETSQAVLLKLLEQNGEITKSLVKNLNRAELELKSSLEPHKVTPTYLFEYQFNHEQNSSCLNHIYIYDSNETLKIDLETPSVQTYNENDVTKNLEQQIVANETDMENENELIVYISKDENNCGWLSREGTDGIPIIAKVNSENENKDANHVIKSVSDHMSCDDDTDVENDQNDSSVYIDLMSEESTDSILNDADINNETKLDNVEKRVQKSQVRNKIRKTQSSSNEKKKSLEECFNIVDITTLQERIDEWNKAMANPNWLKNKAQIKNLYKCEVCSKLFARVEAYERHRALHDPSYGNAECPVCKIRHSKRRSFNSHIRSHSKKYYCKLCPKSYLNEPTAIKHYSRDHSGYEYQCGRCSFSTRHHSLFGGHKLKAHSHAIACELCGRSCVSSGGLQQHLRLWHHGQTSALEGGEVFSCEPCNLKFKFENALRVHLLTSVQHKDEPVDQTLKNACKVCGASFQSTRELLQHRNAEHSTRNGRHGKHSLSIQCEHCDASLNSRQEHYRHMRRYHPTQVYKKLVEAVCATCGKGFGNETILRYHELRHSSPKVRCEHCGRMFYDKQLLAAHLSSHSDKRPYSCDVCDRGFKLKGNLTRHMLIHTSTPCECSLCGKRVKHERNLKIHIRTVHLKIIPPSVLNRKKRTKKRTGDAKNYFPVRAGKSNATTEPA